MSTDKALLILCGLIMALLTIAWYSPPLIGLTEVEYVKNGTVHKEYLIEKTDVFLMDSNVKLKPEYKGLLFSVKDINLKLKVGDREIPVSKVRIIEDELHFTVPEIRLRKPIEKIAAEIYSGEKKIGEAEIKILKPFYR